MILVPSGFQWEEWLQLDFEKSLQAIEPIMPLVRSFIGRKLQGQECFEGLLQVLEGQGLPKTKWVVPCATIGFTPLSSFSPCETGVWLNGVLALHPVHHVKVAHLIFPGWPNHRCPANKMLVKNRR